MKKIFFSFFLALVAMSASATDYYALYIGNVQLSSDHISPSATLNSQLKSSGVLQSGTVELQASNENGIFKGRLYLTDAVLSCNKSTGVIWLGENGILANDLDFDLIEIVLKGTNIITNTNSGGSAIYMGGTACHDFARLEFTGDGTIELHGGSSTGAGITAANRSGVSVTTLNVGYEPTVICDGFTGVRSLGSTTFQYMFGHGTFKATGRPYACMHEGTTAMDLSNNRVTDPENCKIGIEHDIYTMCNESGNSVSTFTVGPELYPLYVCGVQVNADIAYNLNLSTKLKNLGYLKSGTVEYYPQANELYFRGANIEYSGGAIVKNGNHSLTDGTVAPGINNLKLSFSGNNTFGGSATIGIDNNKANMKLSIYQGASLTMNTRSGIYHNMAMASADANASGNYTFTITGDSYSIGPNDSALLTVNASDGWAFLGDYGHIYYESCVTKLTGTNGALSFGGGAGVTPIEYKYTSGDNTYGFRHGERLTKQGYNYNLTDADGNVVKSAEIGWVGNTYGLKILGIALTDYHLQDMTRILGNNSFASAVKFDGDKTLTFDGFGRNTVNCTSVNVPFIENDINGLKIKSTGTNLNNVSYAGTVLKLNAPATYCPDAANRTLRLNSLQGIAVELTCNNALTVENGILDVRGETYGLVGTEYRTSYKGSFTMQGGRFMAIGNTASVAMLYAFNLNNYAILKPEGATWSASANGVVGTDGNLIASTTVEVGTKNFELYVGGVQVTSVNANDILGDGTCSYNATTNTLTLTDANLTANNNNLKAEIPGLTIVFNGNNVITNGWENDYRSINILDCDNVTITGTGTVTINSKGKQAIQLVCDRSVNNVSTTIKDVTIIINDSGTATSGSISAMSSLAMVNLTIDNANIYTSNGSISASTLNLNNCYIAKPENGVVSDGTIVLDGGWMQYTGEIEIVAGTPSVGLRGDVDGSGIVDIDDVNAIINIILEKNPASDYSGEADVDGSGLVDVDDVNEVINIILNS